MKGHSHDLLSTGDNVRPSIALSPDSDVTNLLKPAGSALGLDMSSLSALIVDQATGASCTPLRLWTRDPQDNGSLTESTVQPIPQGGPLWRDC